MPKGPAARVGDMTGHGDKLGKPGPGSSDVFIGGKKAWRGFSPGMATQFLEIIADTLQDMKDNQKYRDKKTIYDLKKDDEADEVSSSSGVDFHACTKQTNPLPAPPDMIGAVIDGSSSVFINKFAACRRGDTIAEVGTTTNKITTGCTSVIIGP